MTINKHNYEAFFLDYHEGNLSPQQVAELLLFVEQHPELQEEFESFENVTLEDFSSYTFENKNGLKKEIDSTNCEEYFMRAVDGALNSSERALLNLFLKQHPRYAAELELYWKTKLSADTRIVFENKALLKRIPATQPVQEASSDHLLISAVEGLLSAEESILLTQQLHVDPELRQSLEHYKQTKVAADLSVVFENKELLKDIAVPVHFTHTDNGSEEFADLLLSKPFSYYARAIAATIILIIGLSFFFSSNTHEGREFAKNTLPFFKLDDHINGAAPSVKEDVPNTNSLASISVKTNNSGENKTIHANKDSLGISPVINPPENIAGNIPENKMQEPKEEIAVVPENIAPAANTNGSTMAKNGSSAKPAAKEYYSLGQIAVAKIKERTLPADTYEKEKKTGKDKKLSGWDVLSAVAKGVSKITGKKVEVQHTSADEGTVTAMR